jgi:membrane associated rhomboid family serine protease
MLLPLYDSNPLHRIPFQYVTVTIIGMCAAIFLWQQSMDPQSAAEAVLGLGAIPAVIFGHASLPPEVMFVPDYVTLLTSMFMHGGWMHLIGNMLFLWVLGDNVEDAMGHARYMVFYGLCGVVAALTHAAFDPYSQTPMIGASGAISGVIGAYLLLHPRVPIHTLFFSVVVAVPAWILLGLWIALQVFNVLTDAGGNVAWWAHIGGAVAGILLIPLFRNAEVPLFDGVRNVTDKPSAPEVKRRMPRGITITPVARAYRTAPDKKGNDPSRRPWR